MEEKIEELKKLTMIAEMFFAPDYLDSIRREYLRSVDKETVMLSGEIAHLAITPIPAAFRELLSQHKALHESIPNCHTPELISWTCCGEHKALGYIYMLLNAIAIAYGLKSDGQPMSELWWADFEVKYAMA